MVMPEQPAEPSVAFDFASYCWWIAVHDWLVPNSLMRTLIVVVLDIFRDQVVKVFPCSVHKVIDEEELVCRIKFR